MAEVRVYATTVRAVHVLVAGSCRTIGFTCIRCHPQLDWDRLLGRPTWSVSGEGFGQSLTVIDPKIRLR